MENHTLAPSDVVYQTLVRLLHAKVESADVEKVAGVIVVRHLVEMFRAQGVYEPSVGVGPAKLPLVHALNQTKDLPVAWLEFFKEHAAENGMFQSVEGKDLGTAMFNRMVKPGQGVQSVALEWWIQNAPQLPAEQSEDWVRRLSMRKSDSIYSAYGVASDANIQKFLGLILARGVGVEKEEPGRPRQRWARKKIWWEQLAAQDRLQDLVCAPSGAMRPLDEMLLLGDIGGAYWHWRELPREEKEAPHGRKKELMEHWVLHSSSTPTGERARRLALSIDKTQGVLGEMRECCDEPKARRKDHRETMKQILSYRAPSGMSVHGWFLLRHGQPHEWPQVEGLLFQKSRHEALHECVAPDGAGLLLQALRAYVGKGEEEFPGWKYGFSALLSEGKHLDDSVSNALAGDVGTHEELANLLVDTIVCPSPSDFSMRLASFVVSRGMISGMELEKVEQALDLAKLSRKATRAATAAQNAQNHNKPRYKSPEDASAAVEIVNRLVKEVDHRGCVLSMTERDWDTLLTEWGMGNANLSILGSGFTAPWKKLKETLKSHGGRLALADQTASIDPAVQASRPRL